MLDFWVRFPSLTLGLISVSLYGSECRPLARKRHQNKHLDFDLVLLRTRRSGVRVPRAHHFNQTVCCTYPALASFIFTTFVTPCNPLVAKPRPIRCAQSCRQAKSSRNCSDIENQPHENPAPIPNNATYLGWVEGFRAGFTVHDELLGVPEKGQDGLHAPWSNRRSNHSRNKEIHR